MSLEGTGPIVIAAEHPDQREIRAFFAASEAYMGLLYPAESNHFVDANALALPNAVFLVARRNGIAVGCGALVHADDAFAEIKRMWVAPDLRGQRVGILLLDALIQAARTRGVECLCLETGISQPEAIGLYRRVGFSECGPFGTYQLDPLSIFMELRLAI